jgi:hypothetical protein
VVATEIFHKHLVQTCFSKMGTFFNVAVEFGEIQSVTTIVTISALDCCRSAAILSLTSVAALSDELWAQVWTWFNLCLEACAEKSATRPVTKDTRGSLAGLCNQWMFHPVAKIIPSATAAASMQRPQASDRKCKKVTPHTAHCGESYDREISDSYPTRQTSNNSPLWPSGPLAP